jgi:hypothetical protein
MAVIPTSGQLGFCSKAAVLLKEWKSKVSKSRGKAEIYIGVVRKSARTCVYGDTE